MLLSLGAVALCATAAQAAALPKDVVAGDIAALWDVRQKLVASSALAEAVEACAGGAERAPGVASEASKELAANCGKIRYIDHVYRAEQAAKKLGKSSSQLSETSPLRRGAPDASYQDFFWSTEAGDAGPLVVADAFTKPSQEFVHAVFSSCLGASLEAGACRTFANRVQVPKHVTNNLIARMGVETVPPSLRPQLVDFDGAAAARLQCPAGAHTALLGLSGQVEVRALNEAQWAQLEPTFGGEYPHEVGFPSNAWDRTDMSYAEGTLKAGDLLFVPASGLALAKGFPLTVDVPRGEDEEPETWESPPLAAVLCVIDASNYAAALDEVRVLAAAYPKAWGSFGRQLLSANLNMERTPTATSWEQYLQGAVTEPAKTAGDEGDASLAGVDGGKRRRPKKNFAQWQEEKQWMAKVREHTLPRLPPPVVASAGRNDAKVEWECDYKRPISNDVVRLGFNISYQSVDNPEDHGVVTVDIEDVRKRPLYQDAAAVNLGIESSVMSTTVADLEPDTAYEFSVVLFYGDAKGKASEVSKAARTMPVAAPGRFHKVPVGVVKDSHSVQLYWEPPLDHGGDPNMHFEVERRQQFNRADHADGQWVNVGKVQAFSAVTEDEALKNSMTTLVDHLLPGSMYQFRVSAVNSEGRSPWSVYTAALETVKAPKFRPGAGSIDSGDAPVLHGHGSGAHRIHDAHKTGNMTAEATTGAIVNLHDHAHSLLVDGGDGGTNLQLAVWAAAWSPASFSVRAQLAMAEPATACRAEGGAGHPSVVHHRVLLVERGGCPLVQKVLTAQKAGALGVIIVDDGRCEKFDQHCVPGSDKVLSEGQGFAAQDHPGDWRKVRIPAVLVLADDGEVLRSRVVKETPPAEGAGDEL